MSMNKRNDLQWLRALAIFAVCAFHLEPNIIPYGYLGVDIFFVLSGYLMSKILSKNRNLITFYGNRIKRIFPTYLFVIAILCLIGYFLLLPTDFHFFKVEVIWSIFFLNNMYPIFHQKQYFEMISEYKFLLHTWSLAVEIQFYLMAPFLITFILSKQKPLLWISFFGFSSFLFQLNVANESIAFGLVFCRIWQFLVGTFVHCSTKQESDNETLISAGTENGILDDNSYNFTILSFFGLITICFYPLSLNHIYFFPIILRVLGTGLTGIFIALNAIQPITLNQKLDSFLVFVGDASYVIYLVHWPIIVYFKYFSISYGSLIISFVIITLSLILFKFFEIPMRKISLQQNIYFIIFCFILIFSSCYISNEKNSSRPNFIEQNEIEVKSCRELYYNNCEKSFIIDKYLTVRPKSEKPERYCSYKLDPTSNKIIMITGNSFAYFQIRGILDAIKESKTKFKEAYFITHPACSIIAGKLNYIKKITCENYDGSFDALLNATKPDIIIHSSRLDHFITKKVESVNISESDIYYKEFKRAILNVAKYTSRLIIIEPNPIIFSTTYQSPLTIAHTLRSNGSISSFNISIEKYHEIQDPTWNRVKKVVASCPNCIIVPTQRLYCQETNCPAADPRTQLGMYCDQNHLTPRYSLCLKPNIIQAIDNKKPKMVFNCDLSVFKNENKF